MDWILIAIIVLVPVGIGYLLYAEHKASDKRRRDQAERIQRAENDRRIYEESVRRALLRSSSSRPVAVTPARSVTARSDDSTPTPPPDNTSSTLAALALSGAFDSPAPSHTPSYDSSPSYDSGSSSSDCGSSSYDSGSSSSSDCGGSSGGGGD